MYFSRKVAHLTAIPLLYPGFKVANYNTAAQFEVNLYALFTSMPDILVCLANYGVEVPMNAENRR